MKLINPASRVLGNFAIVLFLLVAVGIATNVNAANNAGVTSDSHAAPTADIAVIIASAPAGTRLIFS